MKIFHRGLNTEEIMSTGEQKEADFFSDITGSNNHSIIGKVLLYKNTATLILCHRDTICKF